MLINKLEEYFRENNCSILGVGVLAPNKDAHRLYGKLGYEDRSFYMTRDLQEKKRDSFLESRKKKKVKAYPNHNPK